MKRMIIEKIEEKDKLRFGKYEMEISKEKTDKERKGINNGRGQCERSDILQREQNK
jgi:hypothetical protein